MGGAAIIGNIAANMVSGLVQSNYNNQQAAEREALARYQNYRYGEMAAENADARTRALYNDLQSPAALRAQYEAAGLSPSLMFGGNGAGAQPSSGAMGQGASGVSPTTYGISQLDAAEVALKTAEARKLNVDADTQEGKNERGQAEIKKLITETNNTELLNEYQTLENVWQQYENAIKGATAENVIAISNEQRKQAYEATKQMIATTQKLKAEGKIAEATADEIIQQTKDKTIKQQAEIILLQSQNELTKANVKLSQAQMQYLLNKMIVENEQVKLQGDMIEFNHNQLEAQIQQWAVENGFKEKDQKIAIAKCVIEGVVGAGVAAAGIVKAVTPLGALTKVIGF